ncbi:MAG TPA: 2,3-bisphosphoglycerate-independent phosphoglycerate mutase [Anaerolineaceae bacterium]|nr:2,3-bisphosphoglycerate-independent phosphoglycerate mutase [Anaerolineaceae bacterium]
MNYEFLRKLIVPADSKIVMLIMDGLGGLPREPGGKTELETAFTPNLDALAARSALGFSSPAGTGVAVGSGPGHLAIFGFDPIQNEIGRGALEALGVDIDLRPEDVAARGNFCLVDKFGILTDRRAGRLATPEAIRLAKILNTIKVQGVETYLEPIKEHRFAFVMRGEGLSPEIEDTDPLKDGVSPQVAKAKVDAAIHTAELVNQYVNQARDLLKEEESANMILLRGFDRLPNLPQYSDLFKLRAAAIAVNGMYRGVSRLVGMQVLPVEGKSIEDEFSTLENYWNQFDFFYLHIKQTDTHGEDGDFDRKVKVIEQVDSQIPRILNLHPDVILVTGDHSSPAILKSHSWHPVPALVYSRHVREDNIAEFGERACARGSLGTLPATDFMPLLLANAGRIKKYGA